jgi:hypothetical protein
MSKKNKTQDGEPKKLTTKKYEKELRKLQAELCKLAIHGIVDAAHKTDATCSSVDQGLTAGGGPPAQ